jgi:DNA helicase-2/ATP-dependent DNA helicase PcrA
MRNRVIVKLTDSEPSRFIEEIDGQYLEYLTPAENNYRYKPMIDTDIFGDVDKSKLRLAPANGTPQSKLRIVTLNLK